MEIETKTNSRSKKLYGLIGMIFCISAGTVAGFFIGGIIGVAVGFLAGILGGYLLKKAILNRPF